MVQAQANRLVWAVLTLSMFACTNKKEKIEELTQPAEMREVSKNIEAIYSDSAVVKAKLRAPEMVRITSGNERMELPKGLNIDFFDDDLNIESTLRANEGVRYLNTSITRLRGNVVAINKQNDTLKTEELFWDEDKQKIYTQKFVQVRTADETVLADGFESDPEFKNYVFYKIRGTIAVAKPE